jgi:hypothetical protein
MAKAYVLLTYRDGSKALVRMGKRELQTARDLSHIPPRPSVSVLSKGEAREAYADPDLAVIQSCISDEFEVERTVPG